MTYVAAVNWADRVALLSDDTVVPMTNLFDQDGDEVEDWRDAASFVAGSGAIWLVGRCADYFAVQPH